MRHAFTLEYWLDDGWYVGRLLEVPGIFSQAEQLEELEENIRDVYELMFADEEPVAVSGSVQTKTLEVDI